MALLVWAGLHYMSPLCGHLVGCLWTHWFRLASLSVHSAAYRADLVSGETHKDGMAETVGSLPHTLGSLQLVGSPSHPLGWVVLCCWGVAPGNLLRGALGLLELAVARVSSSFFVPDYSAWLARSKFPTKDRTQGQQRRHRVLLTRLDKEFPSDREFPNYTLLTASTQSMKTELP